MLDCGWFYRHSVLGRPETVEWTRRRYLVLGYYAVSLHLVNCVGQGCARLRVGIPFCFWCVNEADALFLQYLDKVYCSSDTGILRFHHVLPAFVRRRRPRNRVLQRIRGYRAALMG